MGDLHPLLPEDPERIGVHLLVGRLVQDPEQSVYLGHLPDEDALRVIRVLEPCPDADPQARERITNELHAAKRVSGAHTARLLEVGWFDDSPYVVREHVEGRSLRETVAADGPLTDDALERLAVNTLTALTAIHLSGLVHRGLNPDTVLLAADGPRVCDIGLGGGSEPDYLAPELIRVESVPGGDATQILNTGPDQVSVPGPDQAPIPGPVQAPAMAPASDQAPISVPDPDQVPAPVQGPVQVPVTIPVAGRPADLFAWAATVVYAATGQPPFGGRPESVLNGPVNLAGIPAGLRPLIATCLDKRPEARPDTRTAMLRLLGEQPADQVMPAPPFPVQGGMNIPGAYAGPQDGALYPAAVLPPAPPAWGAPPLPGNPPPMSGTVIGSPAKDQRKATGFPLMLVAGVGVIALLSGVGIWAAGNYTYIDNAGQVAADGKNPGSALALASLQPGQGEGQNPDLGQGSDQGTGDNPEGRVTVPWGTTPEPQVGDVGPMQLSTDVPTPPLLSPLTSPSVPVPPIPSNPVPTAIPTTAPQPTERPSAKSTPAPKASRTAKPTPKATKPTQTAKPQPKPKPEPSATQETTKAPAPKPTTKAPAPTTKAPAPKPTTKAPAPKPTTAAPKPVAPKPTTAAPKPTATKSAAKPTAAAKPAAPRTNPHSAQQVCGSGFYLQQSASFSGGTIHQLYNSSTGTNCAVALKTANVGSATSVWITLEAQGGGSATDRGNFEFYAGAVYLPAKGKCVRISGGGSGGSTSTAWANCG